MQKPAWPPGPQSCNSRDWGRWPASGILPVRKGVGPNGLPLEEQGRLPHTDVSFV